MLTALTCAFLSLSCIPATSGAAMSAQPDVVSVAQGDTIFERINAARAARQGVPVTARTNRIPHAPTTDRHPVTLRDMLEDLEPTPTCVRRIRVRKKSE